MGGTKENDQATRRLLLLRHAKSAWPEGVPDHQRPLADRGRQAAPRMGRYMVREGLVPDLALVSDAKRTQETWALVRYDFPDVKVRDCPAIYEASAGDILEVLRKIEPDFQTVLVVGHNPGLQELCSMLAGSGDREAMQEMTAKYPTAALAVIDLATPDWKSVSPDCGCLQRFVKPRSLE